jgi:hypothetical protein
MCGFFLRDFTLTQLENLRTNFWFSAIWHRQYAIFFDLMQFVLDYPWRHLLCEGG